MIDDVQLDQPTLPPTKADRWTEAKKGALIGGGFLLIVSLLVGIGYAIQGDWQIVFGGLFIATPLGAGVGALLGASDTHPWLFRAIRSGIQGMFVGSTLGLLVERVLGLDNLQPLFWGSAVGFGAGFAYQYLMWKLWHSLR